jgi:hypothetical protein
MSLSELTLGYEFDDAICEVTDLPRWIAIALQLRSLCRVAQRPKSSLF